MRPFTVRPTFVLLFLTQLTLIGFAQLSDGTAGKRATTLELHRPIESELKGGETASFVISLQADQFLALGIDQRGIDVVVSVFAPDGARLFEVDSPNGTYGPERVLMVAKTSGQFRLEIRPLESAAETGRYGISVLDLRPANRMDKINDLARRLVLAREEEESDLLLDSEIGLAGVDLARAILLEGQRLRNTQIPRERLLVIFKRLLRFTERPQMRGGFGMANRGMGLAYSDMNELDLAETHFRKTLAYFEPFAERTRQALAWTTRDLAAVYVRRSQPQKAIELYERSRQLFLQAGDYEGAVSTYSAVAVQYFYQKDFVKVDEMLEAGIRLSETVPNKALRVSTLQLSGALFSSEGRPAKALEAFQSALKIAEDADLVPLVVQNLYNIAKIQEQLGTAQDAYLNYQRVIELAPSAGDRSRKINAMLNVAAIHERYGDKKGAASRLRSILEYLDIQIARERGSLRRNLIGDKAGVLNTLAKISLGQGNAQAALEFLDQSAKMFESESLTPPAPKRIFWEMGPEFYFARQITTHTSIGDIHSSRADTSKATQHHTKALSVAENSGYGPGIVETLLSMSQNASRSGKDAAALEFANRALSVAEGGGRPDYTLVAKTRIASILRKLNRAAEAEAMYAQSIKISETLRTDATTPTSRSNYFAGLLSPYEDYIDFLFDQSEKNPTRNADGITFDLSERRRARSLLDSLKEARADIHQGVDPNLIEQENRLINQLYSAAGPQTLLFTSPKIVQNADDLALSIMQPPNNVAALTSELRRIETEIRSRSPRYAELTQPNPLTVGEIQSRVLDANTVMLNYMLAEERSFLWVVSKSSVKAFTLPPRAQIEETAKRVYSLLSAGSNQDGPDWKRESSKLSDMLLRPAAKLMGNNRLVIVADGSLQYIPFSSLPDPRVVSATSPILTSNEVVYAPSASVIDLLRQNRVEPTPPDSVAVFADPVFSESDERVANKQAPTNLHTRIGTVRDLQVLPLKPEGIVGETAGIPRLPFSRREAESIFENASPTVSLKALDFVATRDRVLNDKLAKYQVIHFATHGILHSEHPELSGIVLSLLNEKGEPVNGFLRLNDIYNMNLNADLVVLSACQTALGKEVRGEGLIGLTRGFMYAGSPRVVASLWKVDDVATAELMKIFYGKMFKEKMRPAAALRAAKMEMSGSKRWSSPYFWAAFELQGEWR